MSEVKRKRTPHHCCDWCIKPMYAMWLVDGEVWNFYMETPQRSKLHICEPCFNRVVHYKDGGKRRNGTILTEEERAVMVTAISKALGVQCRA